jgi:spermidine/putrescine-binding protein
MRLPTAMARRDFLRGLAATGAALAVPGCGGSLPDRSTAPSRSAGEFKGAQLRVFVYSGFCEQAFRDIVVPRLEQVTGATVILDPGWWDSIPKIKASPPDQPPYDLVITDATQGYPAIQEGLFQQIDFDKVPNRQALAPAVLKNWVCDQHYGITFPDSVMTLAYRPDLVPFHPQNWGDLLRPEVDGQIGLYNSFYMSLYTFACMKVAQEGREGTASHEVETNLDGVLAFAREHRRRVKYWWTTSSDMVLSLTQRNCRLGNMHSPEMFTLLKEQTEVAAVVPRRDRAFVQVMWLVPAGSRRRELAEIAINLIFSAEVQEFLARAGSATAIESVAAKVAADVPEWKALYPSTAEALADLRYYPYETYARHWREIVDAWDRTVLRDGVP